MSNPLPLAKPPMAETTLNLRGLKCPLPALRTRKALSRLPADHIVIVECTDPLSEIDIPNLIRETGDHLEDATHRDGVFVFRIRKR
jgi:tRNA 2-thiouridine synthesizing protein A